MYDGAVGACALLFCPVLSCLYSWHCCFAPCYQAEDSGVLFMPVPGQKRYEGKALYNYGRAIVYIDRGVVFAMKQSQWTPVSLDELKRLAD